MEQRWSLNVFNLVKGPKPLTKLLKLLAEVFTLTGECARRVTHASPLEFSLSSPWPSAKPLKLQRKADTTVVGVRCQVLQSLFSIFLLDLCTGRVPRKLGESIYAHVFHTRIMVR